MGDIWYNFKSIVGKLIKTKIIYVAALYIVDLILYCGHARPWNIWPKLQTFVNMELWQVLLLYVLLCCFCYCLGGENDECVPEEEVREYSFCCGDDDDAEREEVIYH